MPGRTGQYCKSQSELVSSPRTDVPVCDFIQLQNVYLSHYVNSDVEQLKGEINSPVPQHTPFIVSNKHMI